MEIAATINVSTGDGTKQYMYNRNREIKWYSVGSDDTTTETVEMIWNSAVSIDRICLRGHNLKEFSIQYWNGSNYVNFSPAISETANTETDNLFSFTKVSTLKVKLSAVKTITPNQEKHIGVFHVYEEKISLPDDNLPDAHEPMAYVKKNVHEKADGGSLVIVENIYPKHQNILAFEHLPLSYVDLFYALKITHASFWFIPDTIDIKDQYYVNWENDYNFRKVGIWTKAGERCYTGTVELKEV